MNNLVIEYWYYFLADYALAVLIYTLLGRLLLSFFLAPDSTNYIWRFFCRITDPFVAAVRYVTPAAIHPILLVPLTAIWLFFIRYLMVQIFRNYDLLPPLGGAG